MSEVQITEGPLSGADLIRAGEVATGAFADDEFFEYMMPDDRRRPHSVAALHRSVLMRFSTLGTVRAARIDGEVVGVSFWVPPGKWPYPPGLQLREGLSELRIFLPYLRRMPNAGRIMRTAMKAHPKEPMWYLQLLMVDPAHQRHGIGTLLQAPELERCDREGLPAWLETQKRDNLAYYGRFGFEVVAEHHPVEDGPSMWSMRREPRAVS